MEDATILNIGGIDYRIVDASVPSWAKQNTKPSYAANEISGLATVATSGSYNDLTDKPNIPTVLTVPVNSTGSGGNIVYILGNGIQYANIITVLDNGGEVVLKYGDKIYCLSKRENDSLTFSSLQGDDDNYSSFDIDSASRVGYHSGTIITSETVLSKGTPTGSGNAVTDISVSGHQITLKKEETFLKTGDISAWAKASTKPTYTASEVGALPANTHIPVDPVNADWNATSGLAEILHKPPIVQSVSVNSGIAISPNSTNGNVNLEGIVTGIYWRQQSLLVQNGIVTIPDNIVYGMLDNGLWYPGSYDTETGNWIYSELGWATGELSKIYVNVALADGVETYIWTGTKFEEVISTSGYATESYVTNAINALPTPMVFQGTIGTGGTSTTVPSNPTEGDTYKIISGGQSLTFSGITAGTIKVGDTVIYKNSTVGWILIPSGDEPSGTVTSVGMTVPTGLKVSGSPITSSGTLAVTYDSGYSIPPTADQESWNNKANVVFIQRVGNNWREVTYSDISHDWIVIGNSAPTGNPKNIYIEVLGGDAYYYDQKFSSFVRIDEDPTTITNDLNATVSGTALDATQGKILKDMIDAKQNAIEIIDLT